MTDRRNLRILPDDGGPDDPFADWPEPDFEKPGCWRNVEQTREMLDISKMTLYRIKDDYELRAYQFVRGFRFHVDDIIHYIRLNQVRPGRD